MHTEQSQLVSLRCDPAGWGITIDRIVSKPSDLGEAGRLELVEASDRLDLGPGTISSVSELVADDAEPPFGLRLTFADGRSTLVYNWGDDLVVSGEFPEKLGDVHYRQVCDSGT